MRIRGRHVLLIAICALAFAVGLPTQASASAPGSWSPLHVGSPLTSQQRSALEGIAADTTMPSTRRPARSAIAGSCSTVDDHGRTR
jgi:hypothetical protein